MKRVLFIILCIFIAAGIIFAADGVVQPSIAERVKNHPNIVEIEPGWFRLVIKENISKTEYDWRFDLRMIDVRINDIVIGHREEQDSGSLPSSNWVIEYTFIDRNGDGTLDTFYKERFLSIKEGDAWYKINIYWPDKFKYPYPNKQEQQELFQKELEYWNNKL